MSRTAFRRAATVSGEGKIHESAGRRRSPSPDPQRVLRGSFNNTVAAEAPNALSRLQRLAEASPRVAQLRRLQALAEAAAGPGSRMEDEEASPNRTVLPDALKAGIEELSGLSMDHVRVHYNSSQPARLNALAYAQGPDIYLAAGQERHLPHEAWHVVQQAQGRVRPTKQLKVGVTMNDDIGLEREADVMGLKALERGHQASWSRHSLFMSVKASMPVKASRQSEAIIANVSDAKTGKKAGSILADARGSAKPSGSEAERTTDQRDNAALQRELQAWVNRSDRDGPLRMRHGMVDGGMSKIPDLTTCSSTYSCQATGDLSYGAVERAGMVGTVQRQPIISWGDEKVDLADFDNDELKQFYDRGFYNASDSEIIEEELKRRPAHKPGIKDRLTKFGVSILGLGDQAKKVLTAPPRSLTHFGRPNKKKLQNLDEETQEMLPHNDERIARVKEIPMNIAKTGFKEGLNFVTLGASGIAATVLNAVENFSQAAAISLLHSKTEKQKSTDREMANALDENERPMALREVEKIYPEELLAALKTLAMDKLTKGTASAAEALPIGSSLVSFGLGSATSSEKAIETLQNLAEDNNIIAQAALKLIVPLEEKISDAFNARRAVWGASRYKQLDDEEDS